MTTIKSVNIPNLASTKIDFDPPASLKLGGTITTADATAELAAFFNAVHDNAVAAAVSEVRIDVTALTFVNSSSIRLFVDWAIRARDDRTHRYALRFAASHHVTWQKAAFMALTTLVSGLVVDYV